ncbi:MAG: nitrous oxide reductase accessory protein NosL [Desulfobulbaceae bacterium]|nr:nitrous oxide reductase accessory protein NosL [Desulfobulbaceae bacterium]
MTNFYWTRKKPIIGLYDLSQKPMRRNSRQIRLFLLVVLLVAAPTLFAATLRPDCQVCGMWIDQYRHTRHVFTSKDESQVMFCSLTCAARYLKTHGAEMKQLQVADYLTAELIDTEQAIYLAGSDAPPVMSNTSIIAFSSQERAEKFQQKHGGHILRFSQVLILE